MSQRIEQEGLWHNSSYEINITLISKLRKDNKIKKYYVPISFKNIVTKFKQNANKANAEVILKRIQHKQVGFIQKCKGS